MGEYEVIGKSTGIGKTGEPYYKVNVLIPYGRGGVGRWCNSAFCSKEIYDAIEPDKAYKLAFNYNGKTVIGFDEI